MSKIQDPVRMNVSAEKVERARKKLKLPEGVPAVYVVDEALREWLEKKP